MTEITAKTTKAELLAFIAAQADELREAQDEAYRAKQSIPRTPERVPEADALAATIRALDALKNSQGSGGGYSFGAFSSYHTSPIERVLILLAARYGVPLIETKYEPCARQHLDEIDPNRVVEALRGAGGYVR